jgi:MATE family multidrug resistance protein
MPTQRSQELRTLAGLALPVVLTQIGMMLPGVVDTIMLGRYSTQAMAAAAIGHAWATGTSIVAIGVLLGLDPLVSQAHGAGDGQRIARAVQSGLVLSLLLSSLLALVWLGTERILLAAGQEPQLARDAHRYVLAQIPGIPGLLGFVPLRQYLQGRTLTRPAMWVALLVNPINALANRVLIFGWWQIPELGVVGAGLATSITRLSLPLGLYAWIRFAQLARGAWMPWSRAALRSAGMLEILRHGIPVGLQLGLELWAFSCATLLAGRLGAHAVASHSIALSLASLSFMMPLGVAIGASTRVGNLIGAGDRAAAQRAAYLSFALGAGLMGLSAAAFVVLRHALPRVWTDDPAVLALSASILPIVAAFQVFDGMQVVGGGILRGMGRTWPAAVFNFLAYFVLALPAAWYLANRAGWQLHGVWTGLAGGLFVAALLFFGYVHWRGPAHVR